MLEELAAWAETIPYEVLRKSGWNASASPFFNRRPLVLDTRRAETEIGFRATPLDTWLEKTIRWFTDDYRGGPPASYRSRDEEVRIICDYKKVVSSFLP